MLTTKPTYSDLSIPIGPQCREVCEKAIQLGYLTLGINTPVVAKNCLPQGSGRRVGKKRKLEERSGGALSSAAASQTTSGGLPAPPNPPWLDNLRVDHPQAKIVQRLTVIFSDVSDLQAVLNQSSAKLFDVIAVLPTNHEALQSCIISTSLIFDILSFDFEGPHWINKIRLNRQKGKVAADKDVFFELTYSPSFHGEDPCENLIYTANRLTEDICTRRIKNIILGSGAGNASELRSPKDLTGIGFLLGLDETTSRHCCREHSHRVVSKAEQRKYGKTWVVLMPEEKKSKKASDIVS